MNSKYGFRVALRRRKISIFGGSERKNVGELRYCGKQTVLQIVG